jgi:hypothetical protein
MLRTLRAAAVVTAVLGIGPARAEEGFRCATGRLVSIGDHLVEVQKKCGDPDYAAQRVEKRKLREKVRRHTGGGYSEEVREEREIEVLLDEWIYDLGRRKFMRFALFENGRVIQTGTGDYGARR